MGGIGSCGRHVSFDSDSSRGEDGFEANGGRSLGSEMREIKLGKSMERVRSSVGNGIEIDERIPETKR